MDQSPKEIWKKAPKVSSIGKSYSDQYANIVAQEKFKKLITKSTTPWTPSQWIESMPTNDTEDFVERTLVMLKPDAFERNLVGEIMDIIDKRNLKLIGSKLFTMDAKMVGKHYKNHVHKSFYPELVDFMTSGPSLALVYEGNQACQALRQLIGEKHPTNSPPGSIRGKYATEYPRNLIHGSDDHHEAEYEINLYFSEDELFGTNYKANQKKMEKAKLAKLKADKEKTLAKPIKDGELILYPEQVQEGWVIVDTMAGGHTYHVLKTEKMVGDKHRITLCNSIYVDKPEMKANFQTKLEYDDISWQSDGWKLLFKK